MTRTGDRADDLPHEAYLTALASLDRVGPATFRWLLSHGSPRRVWERVASGRLSPGPGAAIDGQRVATWMHQARDLSPAALWDRCTELGIGVVSIGSPGYPRRLADDPDPPVVLFQLGEPERVGERPVAIVGTRRATRYGLDVAHRLGRDLAAAGISVVSGLALGIDSAAHRGAVEAVGGAGPLAVVGSSLESPCPRPNLELSRMVALSGLIYSEVPPGTASAPWRFPVRNRILAALAEVVVVVESAGNGGSMHTVREALDRDRIVMAVPGPIGSRASEGTNELIRDGATPCLGSDDVLAALGMVSNAEDAAGDRSGPDQRGGAPTGVIDGRVADHPGSGGRRSLPTGTDAAVLESLGWRPVTVEGVAARCGLTPRELAVALASLESGGWISLSGPWVERCIR